MRFFKLASISILLVLSCHFAAGQEISVASFALDEMDLTANMEETMERDQNGNKCALIKINTTQKGFTFDVGSLGVMKTVQKPAQIWVYVPHGIRKISIFHETLGSLVNWPIPCEIEAAKTYQMRLTTAEVHVVVAPKTHMDYLVVNVTPEDANSSIFINDDLWPSENGTASKLLQYGTYTYRVEANWYHTAEGQVIVDNGKKELNVNLKPAFGYLTLPKNENLEGATILVDNRLIAGSSVTKMMLKSGTHTISITKEFWKAIKMDFEIRDEEENTLRFTPIPDFTVLSVQTDTETEIFINDVSYGYGEWSGKLEAGAYRIVGQKPHHRPSSQEVVLSGLQDSRIVMLDPPTPILGSADITSSPIGCKVEIDGQVMGTTPLFIQDRVLEGTHIVRFSKNGYFPVEQKMTISANTTTKLSATLFNSARVNIELKPSDALVNMTIDGKTERVYNSVDKIFILGKHEISVEESNRFEACVKTVDIADNTTVEIELTEKASYRKEQEKQRKEQERLAREQQRDSDREYAERQRTLRRIERARNSQGFPASFGWTLLDVGYGSTGVNIGADMFLHLGRVRNRFNLDIGAGLNYIDAALEVPVYARLALNLAKNSAIRNNSYGVFPYFAVDTRWNYAISGESCWSFPLRFGLAFNAITRMEVIYEPCFYGSGNYRGQFQLGLVFAFERRD